MVIPRSDDVTFGILSSRIHVAWVLGVGSTLEDRPVYTTSRVLEPFPFPEGLELSRRGRFENPHADAIAAAAQRLHELREAWLNPREWIDLVPEPVQPPSPAHPYPPRIVPKPGFDAALAKRTLTNLYNEKPAWLQAAHANLDAAVAAAYGWTDYAPSMADTEIVRRILVLNQERAASAADLERLAA